MRLCELLEDAAAVMPATQENINKGAVILSVTDDSNRVKPGCLFVCVKGNSFDGHDFAESALSKGAECVVTERDLGISNQIIVSDSRKFYGLLCAAF